MCCGSLGSLSLGCRCRCPCPCPCLSRAISARPFGDGPLSPHLPPTWIRLTYPIPSQLTLIYPTKTKTYLSEGKEGAKRYSLFPIPQYRSPISLLVLLANSQKAETDRRSHFLLRPHLISVLFRFGNQNHKIQYIQIPDPGSTADRHKYKYKYKYR